MCIRDRYMGKRIIMRRPGTSLVKTYLMPSDEVTREISRRKSSCASSLSLRRNSLAPSNSFQSYRLLGMDRKMMPKTTNPKARVIMKNYAMARNSTSTHSRKHKLLTDERKQLKGKVNYSNNFNIKNTQVLSRRRRSLALEVHGNKDPIIYHCAYLYKLHERKLLSRQLTVDNTDRRKMSPEEDKIVVVPTKCKSKIDVRDLATQTDFQDIHVKDNLWNKYREAADQYLSRIFRPPTQRAKTIIKTSFDSSQILFTKRKRKLSATKKIDSNTERIHKLLLESKLNSIRVNDYEQSLLPVWQEKQLKIANVNEIASTRSKKSSGKERLVLKPCKQKIKKINVSIRLAEPMRRQESLLSNVDSEEPWFKIQSPLKSKGITNGTKSALRAKAVYKRKSSNANKQIGKSAFKSKIKKV
eukprot:TRINITY_DN16204_c0_g1_i3.p1 TRINITY_DN16204_c0_g1~~TRINITY_DN16204_c0_g1_i3.p1  ORF type:complete len:414 (+),score=46.35 TRINITY_DN16204_c0_g1_i3:77-1318(+)